jgi:hypothetical protein
MVVGMTTKATVKTKVNNDDGSMGWGGDEVGRPGYLVPWTNLLETWKLWKIWSSWAVDLRVAGPFLG